jgi:hypothetical protein
MIAGFKWPEGKSGARGDSASGRSVWPAWPANSNSFSELWASMYWGVSPVRVCIHRWCMRAFEQARGDSGAWYAIELTELLPHVAIGLNVDRNEATRYARLTSEFWSDVIAMPIP